MKPTLKIAKNELYALYYSPVAWVIMILFLVLTSIDYTGLVANNLNLVDRGGFHLRYVVNLTNKILDGEFGGIINHLYIFFPLITMGLISREKRDGSINLLYSSPVRKSEIVLGKFLAIVVFTLALIVLVIFTLIGLSISLANPDYGHMIASLIGLFFVLCTYASIGLFISSLTNYSIVAAIITFGVFALFSNMGVILNNVNIARDITFYLNIEARTNPLIDGLINSRDILYFVIISGSFLSFTIIKLKSATESISAYRKAGRYVAVIVAAFIIGYVSTRPQLTGYLDATRDQLNTITPPTQQTLSKLDEGPLQITVFANLLSNYFSRFTPERQNYIVHYILGSYIRFKPNIEVKFVYYYAKSRYNYNPPSADGKTLKERAKQAAKNNNVNFDRFLTFDQVKKIYNTEQENNGCFFLLKYKNRKVVVRTFRDFKFWASENEWAAGFKRLINQSPKIIFLTGHGERSPFSNRRVSYQLITSTLKNRSSLINQGYTVDTLVLQEHKMISTDIAGLAIVDPSVPYSPEGIKKIREYIAAGGNLFVAAEPYHRDVIQPVLSLLGLSLHNGFFAQSNEHMAANVASAYLTKTAQHLYPQFYRHLQKMTRYYGDSAYAVKMQTATALTYNKDGIFKIKPLLRTHKGQTWLRYTPIPRDSIHKMIEKPAGNQTDPFTTAVMMDRHIHGKNQIIIAVSDADYLTPSTIYGYFPGVRKYNFQFGFYCFSQFSYGEFPANTMRPDTDHKFAITSDDVVYQTIVLIYIIPFLMIVLGSVILIRRKRK